MIGYVFFALTVILHPIGQILEKAGMNQIGGITSFKHLFSLETVIKLATNPSIIGGVGLSALGLFFWLGALSTMKVSYLFPFGSMSYILLAVLAYFWLREAITPINWAGIVTIVVGCYLINQ
jgi:drug/metabolite transporter (DMT)-like permease